MHWQVNGKCRRATTLNLHSLRTLCNGNSTTTTPAYMLCAQWFEFNDHLNWTQIFCSFFLLLSFIFFELKIHNFSLKLWHFSQSLFWTKKWWLFRSKNETWEVRVWGKNRKSEYSRASRYTASSCTDLDNARFWIGSKKIWDARFLINCYLMHVFLRSTNFDKKRVPWGPNVPWRCTFLNRVQKNLRSTNLCSEKISRPYCMFLF